jgi:C4-dicarboxylate-specific signal transduction histidine kinase
MTNTLVGMSICLVLLAILGLLLVKLRAERRGRTDAIAPTQTEQQAELTAVRRMRIASHDLRAIGMTLHGNADHLASTGAPHAAAISAAAADLFDMADDLHEYTMQSGAVRTLSDDQILLPVALDDALNTVTAAIGPGRRLWRISPDVSAIRLRADRRALRYILTRTLTAAVRNTHYNDWIDVTVQPREDGLALVIEDEGSGAVATAAGPVPAHDSRGISLRLTLVRQLMQAHGGHAEVDAQSVNGTRISLNFPAARVLQSAIDPSRAQAAPRDLEHARA